MKSILLQIAFRLLLCSGASYVLLRWMGTYSLVISAPLFGLALAKPLFDLAAEYVRLTKWLAYRDVHGCYYAYKGRPVQVYEDASHFRWVRVRDLNRIVGKTTSDRALEVAFPTGYRRIGVPPATYLHCEAVATYLSRATAPKTVSFMHWVEREIAHPARQLRARQFGSGPAPACEPPAPQQQNSTTA